MSLRNLKIEPMVPLFLRPAMQIGDEVELSITGMLGRHRAKLVSVNKYGLGHFEVLDEPGWPILKPGDYILHEQVR